MSGLWSVGLSNDSHSQRPKCRWYQVIGFGRMKIDAQFHQSIDALSQMFQESDVDVEIFLLYVAGRHWTDHLDLLRTRWHREPCEGLVRGRGRTQVWAVTQGRSIASSVQLQLYGHWLWKNCKYGLVCLFIQLCFGYFFLMIFDLVCALLIRSHIFVHFLFDRRSLGKLKIESVLCSPYSSKYCKKDDDG